MSSKRRMLTFLWAIPVVAGSVVADPGDVLWHFEIPSARSLLHRPSIGADGTIYWSADSLYAISPGGELIWSRADTDSNPVGIGTDGTLYVGGWQAPPNNFRPALKAFSRQGDHLWDFTGFGEVLGFIGGPNVGPDGNVYAVTWGGSLPSAGFGAFSLSPSGSLRWHVDGFAHLIAGTAPSEIVFGNGKMYKGESVAPMPAGQLQAGLVAIEFDGDIAWRHSLTISSNSPGRHPVVSPLNGNVHVRLPPRLLRTYTPDGEEAWSYGGDYTPLGFGAPAVGPDGSVYIINGNLHVIALDANGGVRWIARNAVPYTARAPEVSPDGSLLIFGTVACGYGACPGRVLALNTADGTVAFDRPLPNVPGGVPSVVTKPQFSRDGSVVYIGADAVSGFTHSYLFAIRVTESVACYADCDPSTGPGVLDIFDFLCFGNRFHAGDPYACDCDTSTGANVCDIFDFLCFGNAFSAGCP